MAAATAERPATQPESKTSNPFDVAIVLDGKEMAVAELLKKVSEKTLAVAWTGGYVEFGLRDFTVTGNPYEQQYRPHSQLHLESGTSWTGPKDNPQKPWLCSLREILARSTELPPCGEYKLNRLGEDGYVHANPEESPLVNITRDEAAKKCFLKVRLTDKGHQLLIGE